MMITVTSVKAKRSFSRLLETAQQQSITITRYRRPVAVLGTAEAFDAYFAQLDSELESKARNRADGARRTPSTKRR